MRKFYLILILTVLLIFLTTYSPSELNIFPKKKKLFFAIQNIEFENNNIIELSEINEKLKHIYGKNILFIDKNDIAKPLKSIDFLEKIEVKKKYPNTILIKLYESKPIAILFKKNEKYLLDNLSNLIIFNNNIFKESFPSVFGDGAENDFINFFNQLENNNFPKQKIQSYYYFQIGRWDIQLLNKQIIKFPATKRIEAIRQSVKLINREDFKNYNVIDLRIHDKIVVE